MLSAETILQSVVSGIMIGSVYGLMCVGLALIFGIMRVINFAQGEFLMLGMYAALFMIPALAGVIGGSSVFTAILAALATGPLLFALGYVLHAVMLRPLARVQSYAGEAQSQQTQFIITLGISIALQSACTIAFGSDVRSIRTPLSSSAWALSIPFTEDGVVFLNQARVLTFVAGALFAVTLHYIINVTWLGKTLRATADNPIAATYMAIDVDRMHRLAFALGTAITAVAGALVALQNPFQPYVGLDFVIVMYTGVVLGGMGSIMGAFWGGMAIGIIQQCSTLVLPNQLQNVAIFVVFIAILLIRPQGFFGRSAERT
jgi:branched-chain amino acid transport system permease protein